MSAVKKSDPMGADRPSALLVRPGNIPAQLRETPNWVCWRYLEREGKWTKRPVRPNGSSASSTDPATWSPFADVARAYERGSFDGIGIVLDGRQVDDTGLVLAGVDIDKVDLDEERTNRAREIVRNFAPTYTERSPSGRGIRIFCFAVPLEKGVSFDGVEAYTTGRFLTVTGQPYGEPDV